MGELSFRLSLFWHFLISPVGRDGPGGPCGGVCTAANAFLSESLPVPRCHRDRAPSLPPRAMHRNQDAEHILFGNQSRPCRPWHGLNTRRGSILTLPLRHVRLFFAAAPRRC